VTLISVKVIIHGSKSCLGLIILFRVELLHLKNLFMKVILGSSVPLEMVKSLHETLSERRNLPFREVIKEFLNIR